MFEIFKIPTYNNGVWEYTIFNSRKEFCEFLISIFKEPGQYNFNETSLLFKEQRSFFDKYGYYCNYPFKSKDYINYWETEKEKCRQGVIFKDAENTWYLSRDYYMWLNFLPIYDKEKKRYGVAQLRDAQYHMALYEMIAEMSYKHAVILKKRQIASSYFHAAKIINIFWFEEGATLKMGASLKSYISDEGTWKFLNEYKEFLNEHTAWYRPCTPDKSLHWEQKIQITHDNRDTVIGLKSRLLGMSFEKDPTSGVGGPVWYFFYEEAGIAPKMDTTYEYMRPAMQSGMMTTGMFIAAGSVGDLKQCEPLKRYMMNPEENGFLGVETNLIDEKNTIGKSGLFIPEQWSMLPYIDEYGNSQVQEALEAILAERLVWKKEIEPEQYQLRISQKPTNINEAFAYRHESKFPVHLISAQIQRIEQKEYPYEHLELDYSDTGKIVAKASNKLPNPFPIVKTQENKEGVLTVWERPINDPPFGAYYASIDPVGEGRTTTSESLCSIIVYKNSVEVTRVKDDGTVETFIEKGKIVATWCGRYDDINDTHRQLEKIIEWYNAWTLIESNVSLFIQYMISNRKHRYLVPRDQIQFLKELGANTASYQTYGWRNAGNLFKAHLISYAIEFLKEIIDEEFKPDGTSVRKYYGVERIPDKVLLTEMKEYHDKLNVDRLVSFAALVAFVTIQESNRGYLKRKETKNNLQNQENLYKFKKEPIRHMGRSSINKSPFKNIR